MPASASAGRRPARLSTRARFTPRFGIRSAVTVLGVSNASSEMGKPSARSFGACSATGYAVPFVSTTNGMPRVLQIAENLDGAGQQAVAAERAVAEDQCAVEIEHEAFDRPQRLIPSVAVGRTQAHAPARPASPRNSSLKPCFSIDT